MSYNYCTVKFISKLLSDGNFTYGECKETTFSQTKRRACSDSKYTQSIKGARMLESGSAFGDETSTIRFVTPENPENFGRKYPAAHPDEITAILSFFDSGHKMVTFRPLRVKLTLIDVYSYMRQVISFHLVYRNLLKKHHKILY